MSHLDDGRGRQPIVSTGRGGVGNLVRSPSRGVDPEAQHGVERGRELRDPSIDRMIHSGRGGAGNIRSPSRGPQATIAEEREDALQARLVAEERGRQAHGNFSTGRGGVGNISRSKSRSRSAVRDSDSARTPAPAGDFKSGGRGGWGNIREERHDVDNDSIAEQKAAATERYEAEIRAKHIAEETTKPHSSGKGGSGNIVAGGPPGIDMSQLTLEEREAYAKVHAHDKGTPFSTGRGGPGNMHRHLGDDERGRNGDKGVLGSVFRSLSRAAGRDKSNDRAKGD